MRVLSFCVSVETPDVDSILFTSTECYPIVQRIKHQALNRVSVANKGLEEIWYSLVSFVIPYFDHVVLSTCKHVATVVGDV